MHTRGDTSKFLYLSTHMKSSHLGMTTHQNVVSTSWGMQTFHRHIGMGGWEGCRDFGGKEVTSWGRVKRQLEPTKCDASVWNKMRRGEEEERRGAKKKKKNKKNPRRNVFSISSIWCCIPLEISWGRSTPCLLGCPVHHRVTAGQHLPKYWQATGRQPNPLWGQAPSLWNIVS